MEDGEIEDRRKRRVSGSSSRNHRRYQTDHRRRSRSPRRKYHNSSPNKEQKQLTHENCDNLTTKVEEVETEEVYADSPGEEDEDKIIEEKRRKIQEIMSQFAETKEESIEVEVPVTAIKDFTESKEDEKTISDEDDMFSDKFNFNECKDGFAAVPKSMNANLLDNWDDHEGYYRSFVGELIHERFQVSSHLGKGVFSSVIRARDTVCKKDVAIKLLRSNETMKRAGLKELGLLERCMREDPRNQFHIVRLIDHFHHRGHLCLVFESLSMNLRELVKKFGKNEGLHISAIQIYAHQLFLALSLLKKCKIIHGDIKPDNMLVDDAKTLLKLADLGSACEIYENEITPYLVSRFYRAPEIILGLSFDYAIDVWSVGCTLYELYTGEILFSGSSNNQMLHFMMNLKGKFPVKMLRKGLYVSQHFDPEDAFVFLCQDYDKQLKQDIVRRMYFQRPVAGIKAKLDEKDIVAHEKPQIAEMFVDFLEKCLILSPDKRLTPEEALNHPFITNK